MYLSRVENKKRLKHIHDACTWTYVCMDFANKYDEYGDGDGDGDDDVVAIWLISFTLWLEPSQSLFFFLFKYAK